MHEDNTPEIVEITLEMPRHLQKGVASDEAIAKELWYGLIWSVMRDQYIAITGAPIENLQDTITGATALNPTEQKIRNDTNSFFKECAPGLREASLDDYLQAAVKYEQQRCIERGEAKAPQRRITYKLGTIAVDTGNDISLPENPPPLSARIPRKHYIPNTKLTKEMQFDLIGQGLTELLMSPEKANKEIITTCILTYEGDDIQLRSRYPYGEYEQAVYNAVVSLFVDGDDSHIMTPEMIFRAMNGLDSKEKPSNEQVEKIVSCIDKMRFTRAVIDCTDELVNRKVTIEDEQVKSGKIDTYLLNASTVIVSTGGTTKQAYKIEKPPILYSHSRISNQILSCPSYILDTRAIGNNSERLIAIRSYILRRILEMKGGNMDQRSIVFEGYDKGGKHHAGIYERSGVPTPSKVEAKRIRDTTFALLDLYSGKKAGLRGEPLIKDYNVTTKGKKIYSVEIIL